MLNPEEIFHIAKLAKLEISSLEAEKYSRELSAILAYIDQLKEADISGINQETTISGLENILREDVAVDWSEEERMLALNQAELQDNLVKVKKVL